MDAGLIKKLNLFRTFGKVLRKNKVELRSKFFIRIDNARRLYTVINIPEELIGEAYSLKKSDIDRISQTYIQEYTKDLAKYLNEKGLSELYEVYEIKKVDKYSYLVIIGFSGFKSTIFFNWFYYAILPVSILSGIIISLLLLL
jgi:hypothetical protein